MSMLHDAAAKSERHQGWQRRVRYRQPIHANDEHDGEKIMKRSPLPLLMGAVIGTQALLNGLGAWSPASTHHDTLHTLLGISAAHAEEAAAVKYTCPMHPQIISDTPGKCPICGMDLVPIAGAEHTHNMSMPGQAV